MRAGPLRCVAAALALASALVSGACSRGGDGAASAESVCPLIARLDAATAAVARADVSDPDAFERTLDEQVRAYVAAMRELELRVPEELRPDLERMRAAVGQHRFQDAVAARGAFDAYAASKCGRALPAASTATSPTTVSPFATTSSAAP
jgi:hypothetical protein